MYELLRVLKKSYETEQRERELKKVRSEEMVTKTSAGSRRLVNAWALKGETKDKTTARVLISRGTGLAGQLASIKSRGSSSLIAFSGPLPIPRTYTRDFQTN